MFIFTHESKEKTRKQSQLGLVRIDLRCIELTFADSGTLRPPVVNVFVVDSPAVLIPSTAGSATTDSTGFLKGTALWTRHFIGRCNG